MRTFLPWSAPLLPAVATCLLEECVAASPKSFDADLGRHVIVVRGRNAGRRLLGLMAVEAQRLGRALIPPRIVTPGSLDSVLLGRKENVAGQLLQRLAWARVIKQADKEALDAVWESPSDQDRSGALGRFLDQTWQTLSSSGCDFADAYNELCKIAPDASVHEEDRWTALSSLLVDYRRCLKSWGALDPADARLGKSTALDAEAQLIIVGVVELAPVFVNLLKELPNAPRIFIHAPASESSGFDPWGRLIPSYWAKRPCRFDQGEIHVVADATRQAERCAELIQGWRECGLSEGAITVAVLESEALSALDHRLRDKGIRVRLAEGRPASHSTVLQLLSAVAECLDFGFDMPLRYSALASLIRQPDVEKMLCYAARKVDEYFNAHLPERMDVILSEGDKLSEQIADVLSRVSDLTRINRESFVDDVTQVLLKVYGERRLNRYGPEDRAVIHSLEETRNALDEIKTLPREVLREFTPADLLRVIVEAAGSTGVPAPELPDAVELAGWLEAAADDSPALIITSVFEGSLPEGASTEPLLHDSLRERLGLPCRSSRFARDQYTLWTVTESRRENGRVALIAPRRNATGEPTRPSRLLIAGHENRELATRLMALSSAPKTTQKPALAGIGFEPPVPDVERMRAFNTFPVTVFSTYLTSPRLFYFKHILRLGEQFDNAQEIERNVFGTIVHAVLREYGERWLGKSPRQTAAEIEAELEPLLNAYMTQSFGHHALPPVYTQQLALRERLRMFAKHQAAAFEEGWQIAYVESDKSLIVPFPVDGAPSDVQLKGRIDRIDWHPDKRWRVIDYKTAAKAKSPERAHRPSAKSDWKDLQLPLYVKLLGAIDLLQNGPIDPTQTDLVYFNLPAEWDDAGIDKPFPQDLIPEAWEKAEAIIREVCNGTGCQEIGKIGQYADPAFVALCGMNGLTLGNEEEEE